MAQAFPYTYISCPCSDVSRRKVTSKRTSRSLEREDSSEDEEKTFDPRHPRSSFSLFPPEHLLYCEECQDIKCPRCVTEEIICTYCPTCLFEVPSSSVKQDYNRCSRHCFSCPVCFSQLIIASTGEKSEGPWLLSCNYCMWSSLDCGIKFDRPQNLRTQLDSTAVGGKSKPNYRELMSMHTSVKNASSHLRLKATLPEDRPKAEGETGEKASEGLLTDSHGRFEALKLFYKTQIADSMESPNSILEGNFSSPSSLSRIMSMYAGTNTSFARKAKQPPQRMREALTLSEGLVVAERQPNIPRDTVNNDETPTPEQLAFQHPSPIGNPCARHISELRPMPNLLRTKRSKRCAACRHILVKPEFKVTSTRYRIRLVATNYIPLPALKPVPSTNGLLAADPDGQDVILEPGKPSQWILTLRNPLFESVNVSLGTPSLTPGKHGHRVTILCPEFSIGKNGDMFEDTLSSGAAVAAAAAAAKSSTGPGIGEQVAGKVYESGRNWTSVVIEVIPATILKDSGTNEPAAEVQMDEEVIEIPIRVMLEWTNSEDLIEKPGTKADRALKDGEGVDDGKRELAYWMVLGVGRVRC